MCFSFAACSAGDGETEDKKDKEKIEKEEGGGLASVERHYPDGRKEKVIDYSGYEFYYAE